mmetsp:Transcript_17391/g.54595  ORF Transcript_17391/g.54595 Transcript_17391/m.54595 type:complete len:99 (+) Transcript_17391:3-299(+)
MYAGRTHACPRAHRRTRSAANSACRQKPRGPSALRGRQELGGLRPREERELLLDKAALEEERAVFPLLLPLAGTRVGLGALDAKHLVLALAALLAPLL